MEYKLFVDRFPSEPDWTLSEFNSEEIGVSGKGIEDEKRVIKVHGETRIDNGTYIMGLRNSPHFSRHYFRDDEGNLLAAKDRIAIEQMRKYHTPHELIWVMDVPKFDFVLWHWGCTDDDTDACYCVGSVFGKLGNQAAVLDSRKKYIEVYPKIWRAIKEGNVTVTYREKDEANV